ncbi:MAG: 4-alpha-glucanotransferase, partial [Bryobacteraceae bacterium]
MDSQSFEALLDRAAALCGIEPEYWDIFGRHHVTTTEGKQAILRAMGWAAGSTDELEKSLADHVRREWQLLAPATIVAMEADDVDLPLHLPAENLGDAVSVT